jgi:hypothetical protein
MQKGLTLVIASGAWQSHKNRIGMRIEPQIKGKNEMIFFHMRLPRRSAPRNNIDERLLHSVRMPAMTVIYDHME